MTTNGWIGFDLDGTLAEYHGWNGGEIGAPIAPTVALLQKYIEDGTEVRIVTARVAPAGRSREEIADQRRRINAWAFDHLGCVPTLTHEKDFRMIALYDDRCVQVEPNTGVLLVERMRPLLTVSRDTLVLAFDRLYRHRDVGEVQELLNEIQLRIDAITDLFGDGAKWAYGVKEEDAPPVIRQILAEGRARRA